MADAAKANWLSAVGGYTTLDKGNGVGARSSI